VSYTELKLMNPIFLKTRKKHAKIIMMLLLKPINCIWTLTSLPSPGWSRLEAEDAVIEGNKAGIDAFIDTLYEEDFAATMGKQLFGNDFDTYYLDGFWRDGYYGPGL